LRPPSTCAATAPGSSPAPGGSRVARVDQWRTLCSLRCAWGRSWSRWVPPRCGPRTPRRPCTGPPGTRGVAEAVPSRRPTPDRRRPPRPSRAGGAVPMSDNDGLQAPNRCLPLLFCPALRGRPGAAGRLTTSSGGRHGCGSRPVGAPPREAGTVARTPWPPRNSSETQGLLSGGKCVPGAPARLARWHAAAGPRSLPWRALLRGRLTGHRRGWPPARNRCETSCRSGSLIRSRPGRSRLRTLRLFGPEEDTLARPP